MASQSPPKKNAAYTFDISVWSQADSTALKSGPTIAAGDFKISTDGSALANLANLPTATGVQITIVLTSGEMNGDRIFIYWQDASGAEWIAGYIVLMTSARLNDDLAFPATSGRSMVVDAAGLVDANAVKVGPTGAGTAQTARDVGASVLLSAGTGTGQLDFTSGVVKANLAQILGTALTETAGQIAAAFKLFFNIASPTSTMNTITNLTNAPTSGDLTATMKASVTTAATAATPTVTLANGAITTAKFAAGAIDDTVLGSTASQEIADAVTANATAVPLAANVKKINGTTVNGDGGATPWGP